MFIGSRNACHVRSVSTSITHNAQHVAVIIYIDCIVKLINIISKVPYCHSLQKSVMTATSVRLPSSATSINDSTIVGAIVLHRPGNFLKLKLFVVSFISERYVSFRTFPGRCCKRRHNHKAAVGHPPTLHCMFLMRDVC
jgi:hypothetical protein